MDLASGRMEGIGSLLDRYKKIGVPIYQRNYKWDTDQVNELLNDVSGSLSSSRPHFLGCLILQDSKDEEENCEVVDGQQRLTTVFLVLARIQDELYRLSGAGFETIQGQGDELERNPKIEVQNLIFDQNLNKPRFLSNPLISDMFRDKMLNPKRKEEPPERDTKQKAISLPLRKAYWQVRDRIQEHLSGIANETDQLRYLARLLDATKRLQILCITTSLQEESLDVFLTLNNRGLPLGPSDIIRGQLVQALTDGLSAEQVSDIHSRVFREWQTIMKSFDDAGEQQNSIDQFFRYYLLATGKSKVGAKNAPREMDQRIRKKQVGENFVERSPEELRAEAVRIWSEIQTYAKTWITILQPPADFSDECTYQLQILRHVSDNYRVLLLNVFNDAEQRVSEIDRTEISRLCVVLTLRWYLNGQGAQDLESTFQTLGSDFRDKQDVNALIDALRDKTNISPPLEARFRDGERSNAKAILHGIERSLARKTGANPMPWNTAALHVEHVAPDSFTENWGKKLFPDGDDDGKYDDTVSQLGNLTVLDRSLNLRIQQSPFPIKKEKYRDSTSMMTRDLCNVEDWSTSEIENRQKWLVEMFDVVWSKEPPDLAKLNHYAHWKTLPKAAPATGL